MARPKTISSRQILDAARRVFLAHGYRASTASIAREAGISEGTIFKRFASKEKLFHAAMGLPECESTAHLERRVGQGDPRQHIVEISTDLLTFFRKIVPRTMHLCAHPPFDALDSLRSNPDPPPLRVLRALTDYFAAEMRLGRLKLGDPEILARVLMGSLHNFVFLEIIGVRSALPLAPEAYVESMVDLIWQGIEPAAPAVPAADEIDPGSRPTPVPEAGQPVAPSPGGES